MAHLLSDVAAVSLDNASGSLTDITQNVNSVSTDGGNNSVQDTAIGAARHTEVNDIKPIQTITLTGYINTTSDAIINPLLSGTTVLKSVDLTMLSGQHISSDSGRVGTVSRSIPVGLQTWSLELRSSTTTGFARTSVALT